MLKNLLLFFALFAICAAQSQAATLEVNDFGFTGTCDAFLSFDEAVEAARTGSPTANRVVFTNGEKNRISGANMIVSPTQPACDLSVGWIAIDGLGSNSADDIVFSTNDATGRPFVLGKNDDVNGLLPNGTKLIIDGGSSSSTHCIRMENESGSQIRNLIIRNCQGAGIFGQATLGAIFEGLEIRNSVNGISIGFSSQAGKNSRNTRIGGTEPQHRNIIHSNSGTGIVIGAASNLDRSPGMNINILNNLIGTSDGTTDNGNGLHGIEMIHAFGVNIGDLTGPTRNVISGNNVDGISITGSGAVSNNIVRNIIGLNADGNLRLGNGASGIALLGGTGSSADFISSGANRIGRSGQGNIISANNIGVFIADTNTSNNWVEDNRIGTNPGGNADFGNVAEGIIITANAINNRIGGTGGIGNLIAFNSVGIRAAGGTRNRFQQNRLFANDGLGIDIAGAGVTLNDTGDADSGANDVQNFPVIDYVYATNSSVRMTGTLNSIANKPFTLEFFGNSSSDTSGYGEGRNFLGTAAVTTNGSGNAVFDVTFSASLANATGQYVSATATDENGNTSEYSMFRNICADTQLSPPGILSFSNGGSTSFTVVRSTGCTATPISSLPWVTVNSFLGGTVTITISPNFGPQRSGAVQVNFNTGQFSSFVNFNITQFAGASRAPFDFDGDNKTDVAIFRPSSGSWWYTRSSDGASRVFSFGIGTDKIAPVDFTGDGKADVAIFRPVTGQWFVQRSEDNTFYSFPFGQNGDIAAPADYDGDGKDDVAIFRPSNATWFIARSSGGTSIVGFGLNGDVPVSGDYDGDGKADIAIFRPSSGSWWIQRSSDGTTFSTPFGLSTDKAVPGDYTGDGKTDIAVWRPSTGQWFILRSENLSFYAVPFGQSGDVPTAGDYDGDGKWDLAVFRPASNLWFLSQSTAGVAIVGFGAAGDRPVPAAFIP